jgi:hypothetical protein
MGRLVTTDDVAGAVAYLAARSTVPPQVLISPSTAACTAYGSGPAPDLPHETVRKENQS